MKDTIILCKKYCNCLTVIILYRCCDGCDEWFHGDCVGIKNEDANMIKKFYCPNCVG